jgi:hypothetical protein
MRKSVPSEESSTTINCLRTSSVHLLQQYFKIKHYRSTAYQGFTASSKEPGKPLLSFSYKELDTHVYQAPVKKILQSDYFVPANSNI